MLLVESGKEKVRLQGEHEMGMRHLLWWFLESLQVEWKERTAENAWKVLQVKTGMKL